MKTSCLIVAVSLAAGTALAASGDVTSFDGTYLGAATPSTGASGACAPFSLGRVTIERGTLHSEPGAPIVSGYVTAEGSVQATLIRGSLYGAMNGHLKNSVISAGYADGRCSWTIELRPAA